MARSNHEDDDDRDDLLALARRHIGMVVGVFYAPSIPAEKEASARVAHDLHLPDDEPILVLHDGTVFGSAEEGFVVTRRRLCWKNPWESSREIGWSELDPETISREVGKVMIAGRDLALSGDLVLGVSRFLLAMAGVTPGLDLGPYRGVRRPIALPTKTLPGERLIALARDFVGETRNVFYAPAIPEAKLRRARAAHSAHLPSDEPVDVLYDDTYFGSAEEGLLLTSKRVCWKMLGEPATQLPWGVIDAETISAHGSYLELMGAELKLTSPGDLSGAVAMLLRKIVEEASARAR
ncbi:MAG: hypothetical protein ABJE95_38045 [Byssovorax sp.]